MPLGMLLVTLLLACGGCAAPKASPVARAPLPPEPFVRVNSSSNRVELQIAVRQFRPAKGRGPSIWLTGVSHIAEPEYYQAIQKHLSTKSLVLFEGISGSHTSEGRPNDVDEGRPASPTDGASHPTVLRPPKPGWDLQASLAESLGLAFQLEAIDYDQPNFRNSDLSISELREVLAQGSVGGGEGASRSFESLMQMMQGGSFFDTLLHALLRFIGSSPRLKGFSKLALLEAIDQMKGDPENLGNLPPNLKALLQVLIQKRNDKVLNDAKVLLPKYDQNGSISIFFGTGHMPDLERRLREQLHYLPVGEQWFTAISVRLGAGGVSEGESQTVRSFVRHEMEALQTAH